MAFFVAIQSTNGVKNLRILSCTLDVVSFRETLRSGQTLWVVTKVQRALWGSPIFKLESSKAAKATQVPFISRVLPESFPIPHSPSDKCRFFTFRWI